LQNIKVIALGDGGFIGGDIFEKYISSGVELKSSDNWLLKKGASLGR
jgi:hypothetical protein